MVTYIYLGNAAVSDILEVRIGLGGMDPFTNATKSLQDEKQQFTKPSWMLPGSPYNLIYLFMKSSTRKMMARSEQYLKQDAAGA